MPNSLLLLRVASYEPGGGGEAYVATELRSVKEGSVVCEPSSCVFVFECFLFFGLPGSLLTDKIKQGSATLILVSLVISFCWMRERATPPLPTKKRESSFVDFESLLEVFFYCCFKMTLGGFYTHVQQHVY